VKNRALVVAWLAMSVMSPGIAAADDQPMRVLVNAHDRALTVTINRDNSVSSPFVVEPAQLRGVLVDPRGRRFPLRANATALLHSRREPLPHVTDVVDVSLPLPATLPATMYSFHFEGSGDARDTIGQPLVLAQAFPNMVYVPPARPAHGEDPRLSALRRAYVGRTIYARGDAPGRVRREHEFPVPVDRGRRGREHLAP
jgi:hypothetical protein